jgi:hypothetical protein
MWRRPRLVTADTKSPAPQPGSNARGARGLRVGPAIMTRAGRRSWADNATAERREAGLPVAREGPRLASVASRVTARHVQGCDASRRSANPLTWGVGRDEGEKEENPDAIKSRGPKKLGCLKW